MQVIVMEYTRSEMLYSLYFTIKWIGNLALVAIFVLPENALFSLNHLNMPDI